MKLGWPKDSMDAVEILVWSKVVFPALLAIPLGLVLLGYQQDQIPEEQPDPIFIVGDVSKLRITGLPGRRQIIHLTRDGETLFRMGYSVDRESSVGGFNIKTNTGGIWRPE